MKNMRAFLLVSIAVFSVILFGYGYALADGTVPAVATPSKVAAAWSTFVHYFQVVAPWLVLAGIPSLITALTSYPKAAGFVNGLKVLLNFLSMLTHKDSPDTMKPPLTMSKPPVGMLAVPPIGQKAAMFLPIIFLFGVSLAGCASCAHPPGGAGDGGAVVADGGGVPTPTQQFDKAFAKCMEVAGLNDITGIGLAAWKIFTTPGLTQEQLTKQLEDLGIASGGQGGIAVLTCAVSSWLSLNPVAANATPTPAQAAARVHLARHAAKPTAVKP